PTATSTISLHDALPICQIVSGPDTRATLVHLARSPSIAAGLARRARIVVQLAADGVPLRHIGPRVGVARNGVRDWLDRFRAQGRSEEHTSELQSPYDLV